MRYFDKTFFRFLVGFLMMLVFGLAFVSKVQAALIDINTASKQELDDALPGVGPATAQSIIDNRPYSSIQEISRADGIGEPGSASYENIIGLIMVGGTEESEPDNTDEEPASLPAPETSSVFEFKALKLSTQGDMTGVVGQPMEFSAETNSEKLMVTWTFGDGSVAYGHSVQHVYKYPGDYVAVAKVSNTGKRVSARANVKIVPDTLSITNASPERVEISNTGKTEINLYGREIRNGSGKFAFPEDTIVRPGQKISFPSSVTGFTESGDGYRIAMAGERENEKLSEPKVLSTEERERIAAIEREVLALQTRQMELKRAGEVRESKLTPQAANVLSASQDFYEATTSSAKTEGGWLSLIKKFFGFK